MSNKSKYVLITTIILTIILVLVTTLLSLNQQQSADTKNPNDVTAENDNGLTDNELFYVKDNNIFSLNAVTNVSTRWTDYPENPLNTPSQDEAGNIIPSVSISNVDVIDSTRIGFGKCTSVIGNYGCGIYILNLEDKVEDGVVELDNSTQLLQLDFYSQTKYVYTSISDGINNDNSKYLLTLVEGNESTKLESFEFDSFGRGLHPEDSSELKFSNDGKHLLHISTNSPRELFDSNAFIYSLDTSTKVILSNATQPKWLGNDKIIYRQYIPETNTGGYLYQYNLDSRESSKIDNAAVTASHPIVLDNSNVIFIEETNVVTLNLETNAKKTILNTAREITLINADLIAYAEIQSCESTRDCDANQREMVRLYNLDDNEVINNLYDIDLSTATSRYE